MGDQFGYCLAKKEAMMSDTETLQWIFDDSGVDWNELSELYRIAPLGNKSADHLKRVYANSMFKCFAYNGATLVGAGRAVADGLDTSYLCDIAVHPGYQGKGLGIAIVEKLKALSAGHRKIILYANPGKEGFYARLGFRRMRTAMAIFRDRDHAVRTGLIDEA
jgi:ribosomal protein S18 acetylase RimI-like enzyme